MSMNLVTLLYLVASICFIQALKGLSHPKTSIRGNLFGMLGMALAVFTTAALIYKLAQPTDASGVAAAVGAGANPAWLGLGHVLLGLLLGGTVGTVMARRVEMTKMPELVAFMHSMIGLAAVFIAIAAVAEPQAFQIVQHMGDPIPMGEPLRALLGSGDWSDHVQWLGHCLWKVIWQIQIQALPRCPREFCWPALSELVHGPGRAGFGIGLHGPGRLVLVSRHAGAGLYPGGVDHHPHWRSRHACGGLHAQQLLWMGGCRDWIFTEQLHVDHCGLIGGEFRGNFELHHVQGHEPFLFQCYFGRFWRR